MANTKIKLGSLELDNPVLLGSATPTWDGQRSARGFAAGAGAVVPKTICLGEDHYNHPTNGRFIVLKAGAVPYGMINVEIFSTMPESAWLSQELREAKKGGAKIIASTLACESPQDTATLIQHVVATGLVDGIELNNSCPMHVNMNDFNIVPMTVEQTAAARKATDLPLLVKFPSTVTSLTDAAKAAEACGADGLVISNSCSGFAGVDIQTGKPRLGTLGGYSGAAIKPLIQPLIINCARAVDIPVVAVGGINCWQDVVEYLMIGASAVEVVSAVMWKGFGFIKELTDGLAQFMDQKGYACIDDLRGVALPHIGSYDSILTGEVLAAQVDADKCVGCGRCNKTCFYDALSLQNGKCVVDKSKCDGCGLCAQLCPKGAVTLAAK